jgi:hypothetical protein
LSLSYKLRNLSAPSVCLVYIVMSSCQSRHRLSTCVL